MTSRQAPPPTSPSLTAPLQPGPVTIREWLVLAIILAAAIAVRCAWPARMDVEHFDEGVYAANLYAADTDGKYPYRDLYAPPLFPGMAELGISWLGAPSGAVWVSLLGGILLVPVLWWTTREWFGPAAAILTAALAATSDYHAWFSRAALTDAWLCLWMTAGAYCGWRAMLSGRPLTLLMAGGFAALAWWTKYNGWLTLAVIGGGWLTSWVIGKGLRLPSTRLVSPLRAALCLVGIAAIAGALWYPVWSGLRPIGGYATVAKNHAGYFVGLSGWWGSFIQQASAHAYATGPLTILGAAGAISASLWLAETEAPRGLGRILLATILGLLLIALGGSAALAGGALASLILAALKAAEPTIARPDDEPDERWLAWGFAAAWLAGLSLAVPMYRAYPRLSLPWLVGVWLALASGWSLLTRSTGSAGRGRSLAAIVLILVLSLATSGLGITPLPSLLKGRTVAWENRTAMRAAAGQVRSAIRTHFATIPPSRMPELDAVYYVVGEPALFCQLAAQQPQDSLRYGVLPDASLGALAPGENDARLPTYLLIGGRSAIDLKPDLDRAATRLERVATVSVPESSLVLLDELPAWELDRLPKPPTNDIEIYYLKADR
ncbi:ArnT family glycosyltransferase [Planctomyces sp. SH-PL14]|uniref:ArnT family glycosyltransferase n=1 Tax=Planctomyces sp. SH-PL14 TaxID=1632864 RepID=UPI0018D2EC63|nr:phospholipid carrier-dependent glycosyltransferase [Planctomyces sp. SH-PL14]